MSTVHTARSREAKLNPCEEQATPVRKDRCRYQTLMHTYSETYLPQEYFLIAYPVVKLISNRHEREEHRYAQFTVSKIGHINLFFFPPKC